MMSVDYPSIPAKDMPRWENWLEDTTGIALRGRKQVLERGLYPRLKACGVSSLGEYQSLVDNSPVGEMEKLALIDQLTVKDSSFFRCPDSMAAVAEYMRLWRRPGRQDEKVKGGDMRIWSVGCAQGQEAWSLAMVAAEQFAYTETIWQVLGSDISPSAVMQAAAGIYSSRQIASLSAHRKQRFLSATGSGDWRVVDSLQEKVRFGSSNIRDIENCPFSGFDLVFCQNVLIYFREERVNEILDQLVNRLRPDGLLVLGAGEAAHWNSHKVSRWQPELVNAYRVTNG